MKQNNSKELHREAMNYAQDAIVADAKGDKAAALTLYEQAFALEKEAANLFILSFEKEPTRSVLFRSAASLAMNCKQYDEAKRMIHLGLAGNSPDEIVDELLQLSKQIDKAVKKAPSGSEKVKKPQPFWVKGMLKSADAETRTMTLVSEDRKPSVVLVPQGLSAIVRDYWEQNMSVCIVKHGKQFTLVEIDTIFMQKTA
jgi:tetratricopeptide (TPR) repeat protein